MSITVIDSGCGFTDEALKHAAEQFYMAEHSRSTANHYGLGLYIAQSIIEAHHGQLFLSNSTQTKGAEVLIRLPL